MNTSIEKRFSRIPSRSIISGFVIFIAAAALLISLSIVQGGISASRLAQVSLTHTMLVDFSTCSTLTDTSLADVDGGEIRLASIFEDYFYGPDIDTNLWVPGQVFDYGAAITPTITDTNLYINASYLRSVNAMTQSTRIFEARIQMQVLTDTEFGDFGLGRDEYPGLPDVTGHNRLFITDDLNQVFANARTDAEPVTNTLMSGVDPSAWHTFRIEWGPLNTYYYVDGTLMHSVNMPSTYEPFVWLYTYNPWAMVIVDWARVHYYPDLSGQFSSCSFDANASTDWGHLTWGGSIPAGASVTFETRTSPDDSSWSSWSAVGALGAINSPTNRYLQYRASLSTSDVLVSPQVDWVTVVDSSFPPPTATSIATETPTPTATSTETPTPTITETPTSTETPTATSTPSETPTPTLTETASATSTSTSTETPTPTATATDTPTSAATETPTSTATETPTSTATETPTPTASATATGTPPDIVDKFETFLPVTMKNVIGTNIAASWIEFVLNLF